MPLSFAKIKARILGLRYELSFSFVGPSVIQRLNRTYRKKNTPTDVLAFPLGRAEGEIIMCKSAIRKNARLFGMSAAEYRTFLFIHAALHLKGHYHGRIMERLEDRWCSVFKTPTPNR